MTEASEAKTDRGSKAKAMAKAGKSQAAPAPKSPARASRTIKPAKAGATKKSAPVVLALAADPGRPDATPVGQPSTSTPASAAPAPSIDSLRPLAQTVRVLADPINLAILGLLAGASGQELHVGAICGALGLPQVTTSYHLKQLRLSGMVVDRREGKRIYYSRDAGRVAEVAGMLGAAVGLG
jgi:DNA-binding transcriptional ArsR family regulator